MICVAKDFALRATSVSPLDRDKGQRPLTPRKMLAHFSVIKNIAKQLEK